MFRLFTCDVRVIRQCFLETLIYWEFLYSTFILKMASIPVDIPINVASTLILLDTTYIVVFKLTLAVKGSILSNTILFIIFNPLHLKVLKIFLVKKLVPGVGKR